MPLASNIYPVSYYTVTLKRHENDEKICIHLRP
jgi:hypothetical protein